MQRLSYKAKVPIFKKMGYKPNRTQIDIHKDAADTVLIAGG